jgi:hypothetical protein
VTATILGFTMWTSNGGNIGVQVLKGNVAKMQRGVFSVQT